jgi:hypothetical protein
LLSAGGVARIKFPAIAEPYILARVQTGRHKNQNPDNGDLFQNHLLTLLYLNFRHHPEIGGNPCPFMTGSNIRKPGPTIAE